LQEDYAAADFNISEHVIDNSNIENTSMNEIQLALLGLIILATSLVFFYLIDMVPANIENNWD
jgi:hypothetical protein